MILNIKTVVSIDRNCSKFHTFKTSRPGLIYTFIKFKYSKNLKLQIIKKKGSASAIRVRLIIREYKLKIGVLTRPPHPSDST